MIPTVAVLLWVAVQTAGASPAQGQTGAPLQNQQGKVRPANGIAGGHDYQRGSDTLPISVKLLNTGRTRADSSNDARQIDDQENASSWTKGLTAALVVVNCMLVGVAVLQWRTLNAQRTVMQGQAGWMEKASKTTDATLAHLEREFVATHRPLLEARSFFYTEDPDIVGGPRTENEWMVGVQYVLVNKGATKARLVGIIHGHHWGTGTSELPANRLPWIEVPEFAPPDEIPVGGTVEKVASTPMLGRESLVELGGLNQAVLRIFGRVIYLDENGVRREMGFCQRYNYFGPHRLQPVNDPEYSYSD